jgi:uncharacterized membrane protein YedE/YeeE
MTIRAALTLTIVLLMGAAASAVGVLGVAIASGLRGMLGSATLRDALTLSACAAILGLIAGCGLAAIWRLDDARR